MIYGKIIERKTKFSMNVEFTFLFNLTLSIIAFVLEIEADYAIILNKYLCMGAGKL